jgi:hypothetical protein
MAETSVLASVVLFSLLFVAVVIVAIRRGFAITVGSELFAAKFHRCFRVPHLALPGGLVVLAQQQKFVRALFLDEPGFIV